MFTDVKKITHRLSNKRFLIYLLATPPHLKYGGSLSCYKLLNSVELQSSTTTTTTTTAASTTTTKKQQRHDSREVSTA